MAEGRQVSEWPQTMAIAVACREIFAKSEDRTDLRRYLPAHLGGTPPEVQQTESEEEIAANWAAVKGLMTRQK